MTGVGARERSSGSQEVRRTSGPCCSPAQLASIRFWPRRFVDPYGRVAARSARGCARSRTGSPGLDALWTLSQFWCSCFEQEPAFGKIKLGPAMHLTLDGFHSVDLAFGLAVALGQLHRGAHGVVIRRQPFGEPLRRRHCAVLRSLQPRVEEVRLAPAHHGGELLCQPTQPPQGWRQPRATWPADLPHRRPAGPAGAARSTPRCAASSPAWARRPGVVRAAPCCASHRRLR